MIDYLIAAIIIAGAGFLAVREYRKKEKSPEKKVQVKKRSNADKSIDALLALERFLAVNADNQVKEAVIPLIDKIYDIIHVLNDDYVGSAFEINNMSKEVLPARVKAFVNADADFNEFLEDIIKMEKVIDSTIEIIKNHNISLNEREALLIEIKY